MFIWKEWFSIFKVILSHPAYSTKPAKITKLQQIDSLSSYEPCMNFIINQLNGICLFQFIFDKQSSSFVNKLGQTNFQLNFINEPKKYSTTSLQNMRSFIYIIMIQCKRTVRGSFPYNNFVNTVEWNVNGTM